MLTATAPAMIPTFALGHPQTTPALRFTAALPTEALTERHRPSTLAEVVGQGAAVFQLQTYLESPASQAFLFAGPTGVGKTTVARALANDLGVSLDWGFLQINSAQADAEAVEGALQMLRHSCPFGSGWRLVLIDESDLMTPKAAHLWLSALENLPPRSVVVFTTNRPEAFPDRFVDRCETIKFESGAAILAQDAEALIDRVWFAETGRTDAPRFTAIPGLIDTNGRLSFRRVVSALDPILRADALKRSETPFRLVKPDPTPPVVPAAMPALRKPAKRRPAPAPTSALVIAALAPRPAVVRALDHLEDLRRVEADLAALEAEYDRLGGILLEMDDRRGRLEAQRRKLAKRPGR